MLMIFVLVLVLVLVFPDSDSCDMFTRLFARQQTSTVMQFLLVVGRKEIEAADRRHVVVVSGWMLMGLGLM